MKFTAETEANNRINYLDITIHRSPTNWLTSKHRKPTFTDTIIPYSSNHPAQHKYGAMRFLYNILNTYHLKEKECKEEEEVTIHDILNNNRFPTHTHKPPTHRQPTTTLVKETNTITHKWVPFTYIGRETTFITNIFKKSGLRIALRTTSIIQKLLMPQHKPPDKYAQSEAHLLTCPDCNKAYVGQTGHRFAVRFKEHKYAFKTNSNMSNYAKYILEQSHSCRHIEDTMLILRHQHKGSHLNTIEKFTSMLSLLITTT